MYNDMQINRISVSNVEVTLYRGRVYIDAKFSWSSHVLNKKIYKGTGLICKAKRQLNITTSLSLYNYCFVYPYFSYCIEIWGAAADVHLQQIMKLQKRVVRIIN